MSHKAFTEDLQFAQAAGRRVDVTLYAGERLQNVGVHDVDPEQGWVSLFTPTTFDDRETRRWVAVEAITSVTVTDLPWS